MCLGVPGRVASVVEEQGLLMGDVDFGGLKRRVCLAYVPEAAIGDYVVVHAGFAISRVDAEAAVHTLELVREMEAELLLEEDS
jgi:hydrogenase expression/formation protein HypC